MASLRWCWNHQSRNQNSSRKYVVALFLQFRSQTWALTCGAEVPAWQQLSRCGTFPVGYQVRTSVILLWLWPCVVTFFLLHCRVICNNRPMEKFQDHHFSTARRLLVVSTSEDLLLGRESVSYHRDLLVCKPWPRRRSAWCSLGSHRRELCYVLRVRNRRSSTMKAKDKTLQRHNCRFAALFEVICRDIISKTDLSWHRSTAFKACKQGGEGFTLSR